MSSNNYITNNEFKGSIAKLIEIANRYNAKGKDVRDFINVLRRPNLDEAVADINNNFKATTETERRLRQNEIANDFGIGM